MTRLPPPLAAEYSPEFAVVASRITDPPESGWLARWHRLSESANPIVVKEARQAFNSRQFSVSFGLTMLATALWTVTSVGMQLPNIYYVPGGRLVLTGYLVILAFPMLLVIPFSAFRSMMSETEERTFELVSISGLTAVQIVYGKMLSACLQMVLYLSALTPCIVITYLLRGTTITTIVSLIVLQVLISIALTSVGLLIATISRAKMLQVLANILILGLELLAMLAWWGWVVASWEVLSAGMEDATTYFAVALALATLVACVVMVCLRAASAAIDFPSENHSFALRIRFAVLVITLVFWGMMLTLVTQGEAGVFCLSFIGMVFMLFGALVAGELGVMSQRAQRTLPRTVLGRIFLTWFFPGAGLGYIFLCCLLVAAVSPWVLVLPLGLVSQMGWNDAERNAAWALLVCAYFVVFTGSTRLIMLALPRRLKARIVVAFLMQLILVLAGIFLPNIFLLLIQDYSYYSSYGLIHTMDVVATLNHLMDTGITSEIAVTLVIVPLLGLLIFGLNLVQCCRDVLLVRVSMPDRVLEDQSTTKPEVSRVLTSPDPLE